jgi:hypothetical protein
MPKLTAMPSYRDWKSATQVEFPAMVRIGELIQHWHDNATARDVDEFLIERATTFVLKKTQGGTLFSPKTFQPLKIGGELSSKQRDYVQDVHDFVYERVKNSIGATNFDYDLKIIEAYGKNVTPDNVIKDMELMRIDAVYYHTQAEEQKRFKVSFRGGLAHKWDFSGGGDKGKGNLVLYDTQRAGDEVEFGASLFVMGGSGALYTKGCYGGGMMYFHSELLGGAGVLCAGEIRFIEGELIYIVGKSGHYHPTVQQVVNLLERLRQYQVNLTDVKVFRSHYAGCQGNQDLIQWQQRVGLPTINYGVLASCQPCNATDLLRLRAWPGDDSNLTKYSLFVAAPVQPQQVPARRWVPGR